MTLFDRRAVDNNLGFCYPKITVDIFFTIRSTEECKTGQKYLNQITLSKKIQKYQLIVTESPLGA